MVNINFFYWFCFPSAVISERFDFDFFLGCCFKDISIRFGMYVVLNVNMILQTRT